MADQSRNDLAERLEEWAKQVAWPDPVYTDAMARDLRDAAQLLARASTHPEQSARVDAMKKALLWYADPDHWLDGQAGEWIVEEGNHVSGDGFAHSEFDHDNGERARAALEPASPTPTEQGEARVDTDRLWTLIRAIRTEAGTPTPGHTAAATAFAQIRQLTERAAEALGDTDPLRRPAPLAQTEQGEGEARVDRDIPCPRCEDGCERCDPRTLEPASEGEGEAS